MNVIDNIVASVNPVAAEKRVNAKLNMAKKQMALDKMEAQQKLLNIVLSESDILKDTVSGKKVTNSGLSHGAGARRKTWTKGYDAESLSAKSDIEENRKLVRERSRDLAMNSPIGAAAVNSTRTNCVGSGLIPKPKIDYEFLGLTEEESKELHKQIKKEFALWAESSLCDNNDQNNFYELQQIAFMDWLRNGEEFVLIKYEEATPYMPYRLRLKLVEADRVCTEGSFNGEYNGYDTKLANGNTVVNGIEISPSGKVVAYHISSNFPGEYGSTVSKWTRVEKRGKLTGNPNILHIFNAERADQYRGVLFLSPVIESIKQITRYSEAEIMAAVINAMFTIFVQTEEGEDFEYSGEDESVVGEEISSDDEMKMGYGNINFLKNGESVHAVETSHPNAGFDKFSNAMAVYIGAALEIAPEILLKKFSNNFSASKGAMNETWKAYRMRRKWFINDFCQEVYELWFAEAVSSGRIKAPGFFDDVLIKKAYTNATWSGPAQGQLDPIKEVNAAKSRIKLGLSTHEDECVAMNGSDFEDNMRTLKRENEMLADTMPQKEGKNAKED